MDDFRGAYVWDADVRLAEGSRVRRGQCRSDGARVVLKLARGEHPSATELARIRHEFALLQELSEAPVAHARELVRVDQGIGLVLEDAGERSFDTLLEAGPLALPRFLRLASEAVRVLDAVHARGVLHGDVKPEHFFCDEAEQRVLLTDFGIATLVDQDVRRPDRLEGLEGTLAYMSPEQTGRMNRGVDRRSDLYSLGVMFYQLLTGVLPFEARDPLELVHSHIARRPRSPAEFAGIPAMISDIVMRLLAKAAEDRYQSAAGVLADLLACEAQLSATGRIVPFPLGQHDHSNELRVAQKLYGREAEVEALTGALRRANAGTAELVLVSGGAGVGKSALVQELYRDVGMSGTLVSGKFDQYNRSVPYSALARATGEFVRAELTGSSERLAGWRADVLEAVGANGQLLIDLVPELLLLLGPQPVTIALGAAESLHRFEGVFQRFMQVSAARERPFVVFLDDLQWADSASLRLLRLVLQNPEQRHLLVIGSYRDDEIGAAHPLSEFLRELSKSRHLEELRPAPLEQAHIEQLLGDTFAKRDQPLAPLARLIAEKTQGNPFFIGQFLDTLHRERHLWFDADAKLWTWDLAAIEAAAVTSNVVDLVLAKLQRLEPETRDTLELAACIGHRFDAQALASVAGVSVQAVARNLSQAVKQGFVVPLDKAHHLAFHVSEHDAASDFGTAYRFTHDRVQQAAYALIPEAERGPIHLAIGRNLLARAGAAGPSDDEIFAIMGALNLGRAHLSDPGERHSIAALEVRAARRAKDASAPATACELCEIALQLLGDDPFRTDYALARAAHVIRTECAHIIGKDAAALDSIEALKQRSQSLLERVEAANLHVLVLTHQGRLLEATAVSLEALSWLGTNLPDPTDKAALGQAIGREFGAYQAGLAGRSIESLGSIPRMTDHEKLALLRTLGAAVPAAFQSNPELMVLLVLLGVRQPLEHGTSPLSGFFYAQYAVAHTIATGDYATAHRFGRLGVELSEETESRPYAAAVYFLFATFCLHWTRPLRECIDFFSRGVRVGFELGDQMHGDYCLGAGIAYRFYTGEALDRLESEAVSYLRTVEAANDVINIGFVSVNQRTIQCLRGKSATLGAFDDEAEFEASAPPPVAAMYGTHKAMLRYLSGKPDEALEATARFKPLPGLFYNVEWSFYRALSLFELSRRATESERTELADRLEPELQAHARWAGIGPQNFAHRHALLQAECEALAGRGENAMALYDRAIAEASARDFPQHVALANELCGRFHQRAGRSKIARFYLIDARYAYERWGATAKAEALAREFSALDLSFAHADESGARVPKASGTVGTAILGEGALDLLSAMRATQAISSELVLDRLVERVLRILAENSGAEFAALILPEGDGLRLIATLRVEPEQVELGLSEAVDGTRKLPVAVIQYVARSREPVVLDDGSRSQRFARDEYLKARGRCSVLCMPLTHQGELSAILYLENNAVSAAFTASRIERLQFLGSHAAVAMENAKLYGQVQAATSRLEEANSNLEQKVLERTQQLKGRNQDMQRVLDNVAQGLLSIDLEGRMAAEHSAIVERWFGRPAAGTRFAEYIAEADPGFASWFGVAFAELGTGFLPLDVAVGQLPSRLVQAEREYHVSYLPIRAGESLVGLLVVIDDVTSAIQLARAESDQKEQLALFQKLGSDRASLLTFFKEGAELVEQLVRPTTDTASSKRLLHTLKGNAGMLGFELLARACHGAEDAVAEGSSVAVPLARVAARFKSLVAALESLTGNRAADCVEVERDALAALLERVKAGSSPPDIARELTRWTLESLEQPLRRLGEKAVALAQRSNKPEPRLVVSGNDVYAAPARTQSLFSVLVHVLRNSVDHGLGPSAPGQLRLAAAIRGEELVLEIGDDGRGIDWTRVRELAAERGLPHATRAELVAALTSSGFSTRANVSDMSGRGVGLDAVSTEVARLGGSLSVDSEPGRGCVWTIRLPAAALGAVVLPPLSTETKRHSVRPEAQALTARDSRA